MALKGLDIFKLTPKSNCKECGSPTCMAFSMKVAQGAVGIEKCPHMSDEAIAKLSEATAPPMKTIKIGAGAEEHTLGGETVMYRHEKTFVNRNLFGLSLNAANFDEKWEAAKLVDYDRISEHMYVELLSLNFDGDADAYLELVKKAAATGRTLILNCRCPKTARAALEICADGKPILNAATPDNLDEMNALATEFGVVLGVAADDLDALYDAVAALEAKGNKNLVLNVGKCPKCAYAQAVQIRRAAIKQQNRTFGYPTIVDVAAIAPGDMHMQQALAAMFVVKYGSIIVMENMSYAEALPLYGLRQNVFTDPQKPMTVETKLYPLNGADENAPVAATVNFALTYFLVSGELERSGVPVNLLITDAGGYSVLTAWAAGKFSAGSITNFIKENGYEETIKSRKLIIPGKVAVLKGELEERLPEWEIIVAPNEAVELVKFMKEFA